MASAPVLLRELLQTIKAESADNGKHTQAYGVTAKARSAKSAVTLVLPQTRARRPSWRRRAGCPILRFTLGRVARWSATRSTVAKPS